MFIDTHAHLVYDYVNTENIIKNINTVIILLGTSIQSHPKRFPTDWYIYFSPFKSKVFFNVFKYCRGFEIIPFSCLPKLTEFSCSYSCVLSILLLVENIKYPHWHNYW